MTAILKYLGILLASSLLTVNTVLALDLAGFEKAVAAVQWQDDGWSDDLQPLADTGEPSLDGLLPRRPVLRPLLALGGPTDFLNPDCFSPSRFCLLRAPPAF